MMPAAINALLATPTQQNEIKYWANRNKLGFVSEQMIHTGVILHQKHVLIGLEFWKLYQARFFYISPDFSVSVPIFHCWIRDWYGMEQWKAVSVLIFIIYRPSNESSIRAISTIDIGYNTIHTASPAQYDTVRTTTMHTCTANPAQYIRYDTQFVLYFLGEYNTVRYDANRENAGCKPRDFIYYICKIFFYAPRFFMIWSADRTIFPRGVIGSYLKF
jgi:hypothetical protein